MSTNFEFCHPPPAVVSPKPRLCEMEPGHATTYSSKTRPRPKTVKKNESYFLAETLEIVNIQYQVTEFPTPDMEVLQSRKPLSLRYVEQTGKMVVEGWDVALPLSLCGSELPRQIGRRFMELYQKAMSSKMTEEEEDLFEAICHQIDIGAFEVSRAQPSWHTGTVRKRGAKWVFHFWIGGELDIPEQVSRRFEDVLESGDFIGTFIKFDREGEIENLSSILLESPPEPASLPKNQRI